MLISAITRNILGQTSRLAFVSSRGYAKYFADHMDTVTGLEKKELLCRLAGNKDPFNIAPRLKGPGTKECPTLVPSAFDSRMVVCDCEEDSEYVTYFWLHKDEPRRCECGHWYKLVFRDVFTMP